MTNLSDQFAVYHGSPTKVWVDFHAPTTSLYPTLQPHPTEQPAVAPALRQAAFRRQEAILDGANGRWIPNTGNSYDEIIRLEDGEMTPLAAGVRRYYMLSGGCVGIPGAAEGFRCVFNYDPVGPNYNYAYMDWNGTEFGLTLNETVAGSTVTRIARVSGSTIIDEPTIFNFVIYETTTRVGMYLFQEETDVTSDNQVTEGSYYNASLPLSGISGVLFGFHNSNNTDWYIRSIKVWDEF